jgi:dTDP-4-dehydrorhamnose 3,5-epimerase
MRFTETKIKGVWIIDIEPHEDHRGFFSRIWCEREFQAHNLKTDLKQMNAGFSKKKAGIRGMHFQIAPHAEAKTVRCTMGALYDVAVDIRPDSPTYRQWAGVELTAQNHRTFYLPEGCAHGYQTLANNTEILYLTTAFHAPSYARGYRFDDPAFGITWPLPLGTISENDLAWPKLIG